jgi:hypothetical protein
MRLLLVLLALFLVFPAQARETLPAYDGEVRLPLEDYAALLAKLAKRPRPAPAAYAIGQSRVAVTVRDRDERKTAEVALTVRVEIFEDEWTQVPLLPAGAALRQARVDGQVVQLVETAAGLSWSTEAAGTYTLDLSYSVDAQRYDSGRLLPIGIPRAAATAFSLSFPEAGVELSVVPSADLETVVEDEVTRVTAAIPATSLIVVTWRAPSDRPYAISRAHYSGELRDAALIWTARLEVEVFGGGQITLPVMPSSVTLSDIRVDGEAATVLESEAFFATLLRGRGLHQVEVAFQVPVVGESGPPHAGLRIPRIPVSRFDLTLPGRKEVKVSPVADVLTRELENATQVTSFIPMSDHVVFTWTEAIPEDLRGELRANASLYHRVHAEEGVLHGIASVVYEITRGEANRLELEIPEDAQVNRITSPDGGLSDWLVTESETAGRKRISVFLERPVTGRYLLEVAYEKLLGAGESAEAPFSVPLLNALEVHRQRGMVALLSGPELALEPDGTDELSKVGENQLPAFIRNQITMTVAHTFKYIEQVPTLLVNAVAPERKQGQFDARVDTLISLGDVTMKGSAIVEIDVKSGSLLDLDLRVPGGVNVLGVSGPSLRSHQVVAGDGGAQVIELEFTREMDGQFRIEVNYERIMEAETSETTVPTLAVAGAEVEHGRIAVEALSAVEVRASRVERLSSLDINELPQQLVLKTTNPILLAYRYVNATPPVKLAITITRHEEIDVQVAAIEQAEYKSLVTRDGLAVTIARFTVRNSRRQFLRLALPSDSEVWSVFVDGKPEKPAYASDGAEADHSAVLVKMITSTRGFPVEIVYATPVQDIDGLGRISSRLPRPDMIVTHSRWDVFLPIGPHYHALDSTMDPILEGLRVNPRLVGAEALARVSDAYRTQMGQPLRIAVPTQGIHYAFEKLYANQSPEDAEFSLRYVSSQANYLAVLASALGVALLWLGIVALAGRGPRLPRPAIIALIVLGAAVLVVTLGFLGTSPLPASALSLVVALLLALWAALARFRSWRLSRLPG